MQNIVSHKVYYLVREVFSMNSELSSFQRCHVGAGNHRLSVLDFHQAEPWIKLWAAKLCFCLSLSVSPPCCQVSAASLRWGECIDIAVLTWVYPRQEIKLGLSQGSNTRWQEHSPELMCCTRVVTPKWKWGKKESKRCKRENFLRCLILCFRKILAWELLMLSTLFQPRVLSLTASAA